MIPRAIRHSVGWFPLLVAVLQGASACSSTVQGSGAPVDGGGGETSSGSGGRPDASLEAGGGTSGGSGGRVVLDAGSGAGGKASDAATDSGATNLPVGSACKTDVECASRHCINGVCCESVCGGSDLCGVWNFDTCILDSSSWTLDTTVNGNAAMGLAVVSTKPRSGTCCLKFGMWSGGGGAVADLTLHLCGSSANTTVVHGVQIWMDLEGTTLSGSAPKGSVSLFNGSTFLGDFQLVDYPLSTGTYQLISGNFSNSGAATDISIHFIAPGYAWDGTIYVDDVKIY